LEHGGWMQDSLLFCLCANVLCSVSLLPILLTLKAPSTAQTQSLLPYPEINPELKRFGKIQSKTIQQFRISEQLLCC
jgi:hypothetical protein